MHVRGGEQQHASRRRNNSDLRIKLHRLLRLRLFPRVLLDELRGVLPARAVPFCIVVFRRTIAHGLAPISRMKRHRVFWDDRINRQPPVDLAHRCGIPRVAMRMKDICNPGRQKIIAGRRAHPRHVKVRLFQTEAEVAQHSLNALLRFRRMNEFRFQFRKNCRVFLNGQMKLRRFRLQRMKRRLYHLPGKVHQC